jgi:hypothetical protein
MISEVQLGGRGTSSIGVFTVVTALSVGTPAAWQVQWAHDE